MNRRESMIKIGSAGLLALWQSRAVRPAFAAIDPSGQARQTGLLKIDVKRRMGDGYPIFDLGALAVVRATAQHVWQVLTDYDRQAEFVPNLISSHLISRTDRECVIAQEGYGQFLFIRQPVHLLVRAQETPISNIAVTLVEGNMHEYHTNWALSAPSASAENIVNKDNTSNPSETAQNNLTQITYTGTIAPTFYIPSLFGAALMKRDLRDMIAAVVREIEKPS